jgi:hypothetical protein
MNGPCRSSYQAPGEAPDEVFARFETVPASESETGLDETYVVFGDKRIAKRGNPGTLQAGTWDPSSQVSKLSLMARIWS